MNPPIEKFSVPPSCSVRGSGQRRRARAGSVLGSILCRRPGGGIWGDFNDNVARGDWPNRHRGQRPRRRRYRLQLAGGSSSAARRDSSWIDVDASSPAASFEEDWVATLRGRLGYPIGRFMPYATAGVAFTETTSSVTSVGSASDIHTGFPPGPG